MEWLLLWDEVNYSRLLLFGIHLLSRYHWKLCCFWYVDECWSYFPRGLQEISKIFNDLWIKDSPAFCNDYKLQCRLRYVFQFLFNFHSILCNNGSLSILLHSFIDIFMIFLQYFIYFWFYWKLPTIQPKSNCIQWYSIEIKLPALSTVSFEAFYDDSADTMYCIIVVHLNILTGLAS